MACRPGSVRGDASAAVNGETAMDTLRWIEDNRYDPKYGFWSRANVGEVLPDPPSPLGGDLVFDNGGT